MKGRIEINEDEYTLYIDYEYSLSKGDGYIQPDHETIYIEKVEIHDQDFSKDITNFYNDYCYDNKEIESKCLDHARDKYNDKY